MRLISLQKGYGVEQLRDLNDRFPVIDLGDQVDPGLAEMRDTPAIMMNLDLVIVPDTSLAHLAGALGVPVWIPISFVPDFRWLLEPRRQPVVPERSPLPVHSHWRLGRGVRAHGQGPGHKSIDTQSSSR